jgi:tetratricopeptide (TPR) repeat protein
MFKMHFKYSFLLLIFLVFAISAKAEKINIDSLKKVYATSKDPMKRAAAMNRIITYYHDENDSALYFFDIALKDFKSVKFKFGEAWAYHSIGIANVESSRYDEAKKYLNEAISIYRTLKNDSMIAKADVRKAFVFYTQADFEAAIKTYLEAIDYSRRAGDLKTEAWANNLLGLVFTKKPNPDNKTALMYYSKALDINRKINNIEAFGMIMLRMGSAYSSMGDYPNAEAYLGRALALGDSLNNQVVVKWAYEGFSKYYKRKKEYKKSIEIEMRTKAISLRAKEYPGLIISYRNVADCHLKLKNAKEALIYIDSALYYGLKHSIFQDIPVIYELKSSIHNELKQTDQAFYYYKKSIQVKDSLFSIQNSNNINELQTKFQTSEKEKAIELLNVEKENERKFRNVLLTAFIVALVLIAMIVFVLIKINKARKEIEFQKRIVDQKQKEVMDSINYATRIQKALMPTEKYIEKILSKHSKKN